MKKILSVLFSMMMIVTAIIAPVYGVGAGGLASGQLAIDYLVGHGIVQGDGSGSYAPDRAITPAEAITALERAFGDTSRLPQAWSAWNGYHSDWFTPSDMTGGYYDSGITVNAASHMLLSVNGMTDLPPALYGYPPDDTAPSYTTLEIYGYDFSGIASTSYMTRNDFFNVTAWAMESLDQTVPESGYAPSVTIQIENCSSTYANDLLVAQILNALIQLPDRLVQEYVDNEYVIILKTGESYSSHVQTYDDDAMRKSVAYYSDNFGKGGKIVLSATNEQYIWHEFGHYVYYHNNVTSVTDSIFRTTEPDGVATITGQDYCKTNSKEFFAEAFCCYFYAPASLSEYSPGIYRVVDGVIASNYF